METCEYFLGIDSGPMHLAAAMDVKSVIIINDPQRLIYLPKIKECELPNAEWLYPQNVHLNRCGETELVPILSADNILKSISGLVYPYWSEKFLDLYS
jgi:ADP-heptose:LPS heptosyltransferase